MPYIGRDSEISDFPGTPGSKWHSQELTTNDGVKIALCHSEVVTRQRIAALRTDQASTELQLQR